MLIVQRIGTLCFVTCVALILQAAPSNAFWPFSPSDADLFRETCESVLKERLKSPSSYSLVSITPIQMRKPTRDEYFQWVTPNDRKHDQELAARDPKFKRSMERREQLFALGTSNIFIAYLEYDAANSFGALLRGHAECSIIKGGEAYKFIKLDEISMRVDGYTALSWSTAQLR